MVLLANRNTDVETGYLSLNLQNEAPKSVRTNSNSNGKTSLEA
jgi:hypothetical protein